MTSRPSPNNYVEQARAAIRRVFENTAVPVSVTKETLEELREEIDTLIDALPEGKERRG